MVISALKKKDNYNQNVLFKHIHVTLLIHCTRQTEIADCYIECQMNFLNTFWNSRWLHPGNDLQVCRCTYCITITNIDVATILIFLFYLKVMIIDIGQNNYIQTGGHFKIQDGHQKEGIKTVTIWFWVLGSILYIWQQIKHPSILKTFIVMSRCETSGPQNY